ncbi:hypothetical protein HG531_001050 [Fusarium graminearum]|nr:hypothetical protein HG531_001050 [Fusarium graminearum]
MARSTIPRMIMAMILLNKKTLLLGLLEVVSQKSVERCSDDREDNGEGTEAPSPLVAVEEESLSGLGTGKGGDHVRRRGERVRETSVLELCGIGRDNVDTVGQTGPSNLPEDLEEAAHGEEDHEEEALSTAPEIENLGQRDVDSGSHTVGDDTDDGHERVRLPLTACVGKQSVVDLPPVFNCDLTARNVQDKDTSEGLFAPSQRGSLNSLDTMLRVFGNGIAVAPIVGEDTSLLVLLVDGGGDSYGLLSSSALFDLAPEGELDLVENSHGVLVF